MARPKKSEQKSADEHIFRCSRCGREYANAVGKFYKNSNSSLFKANYGFVTICKDCVEDLFTDYCKKLKDQKLATIILCYMLDVPFYHGLYETVAANSDNFNIGLLMRTYNNRQYNNQTFAQTLITNELTKDAIEIRNHQEKKAWEKEELYNMETILEAIGYDPFDGFPSDDRRYLFNEFIKFISSEDIMDDHYKMSQIIQVIINNNQIRKMDLVISTLNPVIDVEPIKNLSEVKQKLVANNDKIAKENEISVKNRSNKDVGKNTLTFLMRDLRMKDFDKAETNYYNQLSSRGTQWAADMSFKALKENAFFDENDYKEMSENQYKLVQSLQQQLDDEKEKNRLLLVENIELKRELEDVKATDENSEE